MIWNKQSALSPAEPSRIFLTPQGCPHRCGFEGFVSARPSPPDEIREDFPDKFDSVENQSEARARKADGTREEALIVASSSLRKSSSTLSSAKLAVRDWRALLATRRSPRRSSRASATGSATDRSFVRRTRLGVTLPANPRTVPLHKWRGRRYIRRACVRARCVRSPRVVHAADAEAYASFRAERFCVSASSPYRNET